MVTGTSANFSKLIQEIPHIAFKRHAGYLADRAILNLALLKHGLQDLKIPVGKKSESVIIISAGPGVRRRNSIKRILDSGYQGTVIAADGAYVACLKAGLIPDYVVSLDPCDSRVVRWFGDPDFERNSENDDYFARQDLDIDFRKNSIAHNLANIKLVNELGHKTKAIAATCLAENVVDRLREAKFDIYWWNPLVDNPNEQDSITRKLYEINKLPCVNTGGTVGTAAWVIAATRLNFSKIGLVGMDYGYYPDTKLIETQTYYELVAEIGTEDGIEQYFPECVYPATGEKFFTDPTYYWYRQNFLELLKNNNRETKTYNCTEGGTLFGERLECVSLDDFLELSR